MGNKKNQEAFANGKTQRAYPPKPIVETWQKTENEIGKLNTDVEKLVASLEHILELERTISKRKNELLIWKEEERHFQNTFPDVSALPHEKANNVVERAHKIRDYFVKRFSREKKLSFAKKFVFSYLYRIGSWRLYTESLPANLELSLNRLIFDEEIRRRENELLEMENELSASDAQRLKDSLRKCSQDLLYAHIYHTYETRICRDRKRFSKEDLSFKMKELVEEYPIITSTTNAAKNQQGNDCLIFDYLIVDESSQANLITGALALSAARNAVIVGDTKQLPCVIKDSEKKLSSRISKEVPPCNERFFFSEHNLLSSTISGMCQHHLKDIRTMLVEHYRCDPRIIGFCNERFYDGQLIPMTHECKSNEQPLCILPIKEHTDRNSDFNRVQAREFEAIVKKGVFSDLCLKDIGAITPYRKQVNGMKENGITPEIDIDTVHKFQGREKRAIAFITVKNYLSKFLDDPNIINVSVSRATERFTLIVQSDLINKQSSGNLPALAQYMRYHGGAELERRTSSVFDLLYPEHKKELKAKSSFSNNDVPSEQLFAELLSNVLEKQEVARELKFVRNYPLKQIFIDIELTNNEQRYIDNGAHVDFLIYRITDKVAVCGIEVNGSKHFSSKRRRLNDKTKKSIFDKAGVPLHTFATHDVNEYERLNRIIKTIWQSDSTTTFQMSSKPQYVVVEDPEKCYNIEDLRCE